MFAFALLAVVRQRADFLATPQKRRGKFFAHNPLIDAGNPSFCRLLDPTVQIPIESGHGFRRESGQCSDRSRPAFRFERVSGISCSAGLS
jgi:hypothetical protein